MKTNFISENKIKRDWYIFDVKGKRLGLVSTRIAQLLIGKGKSEYSPNVVFSDHVVVVNASDISINDRKIFAKKYFHHTGYPGGIKEINFFDLRSKSPSEIIKMAVKGMLPKTKLGDKMFSYLHVFDGSDHSYTSVDLKKID